MGNGIFTYDVEPGGVPREIIHIKAAFRVGLRRSYLETGAIEQVAGEYFSRLRRTSRDAYEYLRAHPALVLVFMVFILYFITRLVAFNCEYMFSDESHFIRWAQMARGGNPWYSLLYDGKLPLHAWAIVPFLYIFKDPLIAGRLTSVFFGAVTVFTIILIGREFRNLLMGALTAFLYVICPYTLLYDRTAEAEGMLLALFLIAIYFAVRAAKSMNLLNLLGTSLFTGLALWTKGTALLLFPIVPFAYVVGDPARRQTGARRPLLRWIITVAVSLLLGFGVYSLIRLTPAYKNRSPIVSGRTKSLSEALGSLGDFPKLVGSIFSTMFRLFTPVLFIICFAGLLVALFYRWRPVYFLWIWIILGVFIIALISRNYWARFYLVLVPPMLFGGGFAIHKGTVLSTAFIRKRKGWSRFLLTTAALLLVVTVVVAVAVPVGFKSKEIARCRVVPGGNYLGVHTSDIVSCLKGAENEERVRVFAASRDDHFLERCLNMYLGEDDSIDIGNLPHPIQAGPIPPPRSCGLSEVLENNREALEEALGRGPVYLVVDSIDNVETSGEWQTDVLREYRIPKVEELDIKTVNAADASTILVKVER